ncbi:DNA helicase-2 / ATP-dependent DNA helicase PcrA [Caloramator proteoclasticus DSM 10124]|uniref:ATP-dependent DNA helicase n=1 Tax=Caloramator proteoclasticus DSM 10124 TaxID=1121262 RepID=A0A1M4VYW9_9CLOT|nr:DNA helicase-2 / ATP-dependent DNA helicase PcrA [Caloramator proteoclasticus DSM 10124]
MLDLSVLNKEQREAVETLEGPLLILAGAGSGKTRVLTYRIANLIENGVYPGNILAITFTNKAAQEMKERIIQIVGDEARNIWISTFHSACVRILRQDIEKIGYNKDFVIYDTQDQEKIIKECLSELNIDEKAMPPKDVLSKIGSLKDDLIDAETYYSRYGMDFKTRNLANIYKMYQRKLKKSNALDFDDIIMLTVKLFKENEDVLNYYRRKFRYILVDEYQDTNRAQYEFVNILAKEHRNLCVVGDDDQCIYSWRHADIRNILEFEKDFPDVKVIKLEQNYRCTKKILDAANYVIQNNENRKHKRLWTQNELGENVRFYKAENGEDEALFIVKEIKRLVQEGYSLSDFAVLYRTNAMSRILEEAFVTSSVPYRVVGGLKFYDRKEIRDILAYLRVINNPLDNISLERIINVPRRGIGQATIDKVKEYANSRDISLYSALLEIDRIDGITKRAANAIEKFISQMNYFIVSKDRMTVSSLISEILDTTGYIKELLEDNTKESQDRIENLNEFKSAAVEFEEQNEDKSLAAFLERIALVSDQDQIENIDAVTLMTLHTAKGLEFNIVFIAAMEEGIFPHFSAKDDEDELEEERRLCYVGITRAKKKLYLTCAQQRMMYGRTMFNNVSSFIEEIPEHLIDDISPKRMSFNRVYNYDDYRAPSKTISTVNKINTTPVIQKPNLNKSANYDVGMLVKHKIFGVGKVVAVKEIAADKMITVEFDKAGVKNLLASTAPLEKI